MQNRRNFIKTIIACSAPIVLPQNAFALNQSKTKQLTLLHTNDVHSRIEPFPDNDLKYPGMGGVAMRTTLINKIRHEKDYTLLLDAGDIFQGTPYFNFFKGDIEIDIMNKLGYECSTLGNHEFDNGVIALAKQIERANFPFVNCNYDFTNSALNGKIHRHVIIQKGSIKIGITGCGIELNNLVLPDNFIGIEYQHPINKIQEQADILKYEKKCDLIIVLSHLGYAYNTNKISDLALAQQTKNIDIIIGGHTHTFLNEPTIINNIENKNVLINQVGFAGINLGQIDLFFEKKPIKKYTKNHIVISD